MPEGGTSELTLLLPGLCGPGLPTARFPALESLLARAAKRSYPPAWMDWILCRRFGIACSPMAPPVAPLTRLLDGPGAREGVWMRADPVYMAAGSTGAVLWHPELLCLAHEEAQALAAEVADLFLDLGASLQVGSVASRWYLHLPELPSLQTTPLAQAAGRNIRSMLPQGVDQAAWNRVLSEVQMRLHASPINQDRRRQGKYPVNGLWCWGSGRLPMPALAPAWDWIYSDEVLSRSLAELHQIPHEDLPGQSTSILAGPGQRVLAVLSVAERHCAHGDKSGCLDFLHTLERDWCIPLKRALARGVLHTLSLIMPPTLEFRLHRSSLWRRWRRPRPLASFALRGGRPAS